MNQILIFIMACLTATSLGGQAMSWREHVKTADKLFENREYPDAGHHYEMAWRRKTDKLEYMYQSGECFWIARDYHKAGEAFRIVRERTKLFPLATFKYAQCLKNSGKYQNAKQEFELFINNYREKDALRMTEMVKREIEGCKLGMKMMATAGKQTIELEHLSANINTLESEFAPVPFSDDILYFSSTMAGKAKIYRSQNQSGQWTKASVLESFPVIEGEHFCNGAFSPDKKRFYFTQCESIQVWGALSSRCEIYVTKREGSEWLPPQRLHDYVNPKESTTTHPFVIQEGTREIVYFSSNREGGQGGMDIWYMERDLDSDDIDFTFPANAGPDINTSGDEIAPFYSGTEETLYFSSNGHINMGGFDIYQARGSKARWTKPEPLAPPINSCADDYFFRLKPLSKDGFFVSNRIFGTEKITTTHEDIFAFYQPVMPAVVKGLVLDKLTNKPVKGSEVRLFEIIGHSGLVSTSEESDQDTGTAREKRRLLDVNITSDGKYQFALIPNRNFRLEAFHEEYLLGYVEFTAGNAQKLADIEENLLLQKAAPNQIVSRGSIPVPQHPPSSDSQASGVSIERDGAYPPVKINQSPVNVAATEKSSKDTGSSSAESNTISYVTRAKTPGEPFDIVTSAPRHEGVYYKVQLIAVVKFDSGQDRYKPVEHLGRFDTEYIPSMKLTRVLLGDYYSLEEAQAVLDKASRYRTFKGAYIVRYENGVRLGRWQ